MSAKACRPVGRHGPHDVGGSLGRSQGGARCTVTEGNDHGEVVRDDVVHFADDAGAFGDDGEFVGLVAFAFEAFGAVVQFSHIGPSGRGVQAQPERRGDHAGEEDAGVPPPTAADADRDADRTGLEHCGGDEGLHAGAPGGHRVEGDQRADAAGQADVQQSGQTGGHEQPGEHRNGPHPADH